MVKSFAKVHGMENLSAEAIRGRDETLRLHPGAVERKERDSGVLDDPFTLGEMVRALNKSKHTSPGKDRVCYKMLKNLGGGALGVLLGLYNRVWVEGKLPQVWKEAVVVPIRKPGKDPTLPSSYRPIALTSNICKVMVRMVTDRLTYILEKGGLLAGYQSGFRKGRNTIDAVVRLEDEIRRAQANKESVVAVFFDIEKAYDMMWREGLLIKLHKLEVGGRTFNWVRDFLSDRIIQVRIGVELSSQLTVNNGTPQGSVISPLLYILMINDIFARVPGGIGRSLFADDGALWKRGRNVEAGVRHVQGAIDEVEQWGLEWGCRFSVEKTQTMFFTRKKVGEGVRLRLYGQDLVRVGTFKYLGVVFDSRLTWESHVKRIVEKGKRVLNVLRCLAGRDWGASCEALRSIYVALMRSAIDYGCLVYGSAAQTHLRKLDVLQAQALRICSGAFKSTSVPALQVATGEMPLELRRGQLMANYWLSLQGFGDSHPTRAVLMDCWENGKRKKANFGRVGKEIAGEFGVAELNLCPSIVYPEVAPWRLEWPDVDWGLLECRKSGEVVDLVGAFETLVKGKYGRYTQVFTDGSKDPETGMTGFGVVVPGRQASINRRTTDGLSVYTVEMVAILIAMKWVEHAGVDRVVICSDSASVLASLRSFKSGSRQGMLYEILISITKCVERGSEIKFMWVPAHLGIEGNEQADELAKRALRKDRVDMNVRISKAEAKGIVWEMANLKWQERWDREEKGRHFYQAQHNVKERRVGRGRRREEIIWMRVRLGHCALNKTLKLVGRHQSGLCEGCGEEEESVEHVLMGCRAYESQRRVMRARLREVGTQGFEMRDVLRENEGANAKIVIDFLRKVGVVGRI